MRVLLIEDDPDIAEAITVRLERHGYDVLVCAHGEDAVDHTLDTTFGIILLDLNLPGRNGLELLRDLRGEGATTPVLVLTARAAVDDKLSLFDLGADDYLVKPFDMRELEARIGALLRRSRGVSQPVLRHGDLELNLSTGSVTLGGDPLNLGRREVELLSELVAASPNVVPKQRLVLRLFGYEGQGSSNTVELIVSRLRRKLASSRIKISTQRSVGYFLETREATKDEVHGR